MRRELPESETEKREDTAQKPAQKTAISKSTSNNGQASWISNIRKQEEKTSAQEVPSSPSRKGNETTSHTISLHPIIPEETSEVVSATSKIKSTMSSKGGPPLNSGLEGNSTRNVDDVDSLS